MRIWINLNDNTAQILRELARKERRRTRDQAAVLLEEAIGRREPDIPKAPEALRCSLPA